MTMPHERTRALRWGRELLAELADDAAIAAQRHERAARLLADYPTADAIEKWIQDDACPLALTAAKALADAARLFGEMRFSAEGSATTRRSVTFTLRHFPQADECLRMATPGWPADGLGPWLLPEDSPI